MRNMGLKGSHLAGEESAKDIDRIADEIVELLLSSKDDLKKAEHGPERPEKSDKLEKLGRLEKRVEALENRVEKYIGSFKIAATESGRSITEKTENLKNDMDSGITDLRGELDELRTAMIRLSNEVKKMSESRF